MNAFQIINLPLLKGDLGLEEGPDLEEAQEMEDQEKCFLRLVAIVAMNAKYPLSLKKTDPFIVTNAFQTTNNFTRFKKRYLNPIKFN